MPKFIFLLLFHFMVTELIQQGRDQRDYFYFVGLGHYKLEVKNTIYTHLDSSYWSENVCLYA